YRGGSSAEVMRRHVDSAPIWTPAVPEALRPLLAACLHRDPAARPDPVAFAGALRAVAPALAGWAAAIPLPDGTPHFRPLPAEAPAAEAPEAPEAPAAAEAPEAAGAAEAEAAGPGNAGDGSPS